MESSASEFARCEAFMRRELPGRVRGELEARIERALAPVEENLKHQLVGIVQELQATLFEEFKQSSRQGHTQRTGDKQVIREGAVAETPCACNQTIYSPLIQDNEGTKRDAMMPYPDVLMDTAAMQDAWRVSQPVEVTLSSYPFIVDDSAAFLSVAQNSGNWDSQWTDAAYRNWM